MQFDPFKSISEVMSEDVITVTPRDDMEVVHKIFEGSKIHHIPVINPDNTLAGILSKSDYLRISYNPENPVSKPSEDVNDMIYKVYKVKDVMTTKIAKLNPSDYLFAAAEVFQENLFHCIPIVDQDNKLKGILTPYDLINYCFKRTTSST